MYILRCLILFLGFFPSLVALAQFQFTPVHPTLSGQLLYEAIRSDYRATRIFEYAVVRDTLFLKVDAVNRNLSCIYTNLTLPIPEGSDPTTAVFLNGNINGINTEHIYPLSLGTENTPAQSDMHHLYPSRVKTNADRGNLPFGDSPDANTQRWYRDKEELTNKPATNADEFSELGLSIFEPRESVKGDLARSMFYVFTMYRDEVKAIDDQYFQKQKQSLCEWHFADPVDEKEWKRTHAIASYQGNANPFVLDCSLAARMYCDQISTACSLLDAKDIIQEASMHYDAYTKTLLLRNAAFDQLFMYDMSGKIIQSWNFNAIENEVALLLNTAQSGIYCLILHGKNKTKSFRFFIP